MVSAAAVASVDEDPSKLSAGTATPPNCVKVPLWICTATLAAALFGIVAITMTLPAWTSMVISDASTPAELARSALIAAILVGV
jgi:hypothetical protein